jgi:hypothetical protein
LRIDAVSQSLPAANSFADSLEFSLGVKESQTHQISSPSFAGESSAELMNGQSTKIKKLTS